jgi:ribonuclease HI
MRDAVERGTAGGYAFVSTWRDRRIEGYGCAKTATSNQMELAAIWAGLRSIKPVGLPVIVKTDSRYCINAITVWQRKWRANGWTTATGQPVKNRAFIITIQKAIGFHENGGGSVTFEHVRGHAGHAENERCDYLAGNARREGKCSCRLGIYRVVQQMVDHVNAI